MTQVNKRSRVNNEAGRVDFTRDVTSGQLASIGFDLYSANFVKFMLILIPAYAVYLVLYFLAGLLPLGQVGSNLATTLSGQILGGTPTSTSAQWGTLLVSYAENLVKQLPVVLGSAAVCVAAANAYLGRSISIAQAYRAAIPAIGGLIVLVAISELTTLVSGAPLGIGTLNACFLLVVELGLLFFLIFVVSRWQVAQQVVIFERLDAVSALRRSWYLIDEQWRGRAIGLWFTLALYTVVPLIIVLVIIGAVNYSLLSSPLLSVLVGLLITPWFESAFTVFYLHHLGRSQELTHGTMLASLVPVANDTRQVG